MPFGLKNAGVTYQGVMVVLFHDMIHKDVKVYVDNLATKSHPNQTHVTILQILFKRLRKYKLRLNPNKYVFSALSKKLLGFIISQEGI